MHTYIHPRHNARLKIFLLDAENKYIQWPITVIPNYGTFGRLKLERVDNNLALEVTATYGTTCREALCNSFNTWTSKRLVPLGCTATLKPPTSKSGRSLIRNLASFSLEVAGSDDGLKVQTDNKYSKKVYMDAYKLITSRSNMEEAYALMDIVMGTVAMLIGGPSAYTRTLVSKNKVQVVKGRKTAWHNGKYSRSGAFSFTSGVSKVAKRDFIYTGVSNFWMCHPACLSLMSGLSKFALELWFDGKYREIDAEMGVASLRRWLAQMAKKKQFNRKDKDELMEVLGWFDPYFSSAKVTSNLGGYPINAYTIQMLSVFIEEDYISRDFSTNWKNENDLYGLSRYGFYTWCKKKGAKATPKFKDRPSGGWGGLNGRQVGFAGH